MNRHFRADDRFVPYYEGSVSTSGDASGDGACYGIPGGNGTGDGDDNGGGNGQGKSEEGNSRGDGWGAYSNLSTDLAPLTSSDPDLWVLWSAEQDLG